MSAAGPMSNQLLADSAAYRLPSMTINCASRSEPPIVMVALPCTAVAGTLVRSPDSFLSGRPSILPSTAMSRCALFRFLVVWLDCCSNVPASGSVSVPDDPEDEHPAISPDAMVTAAKAERAEDMRDL